MPAWTPEWEADFLRRNPGDTHRLQSAWDSNNTSSQGREFDSQGPMYDQATNQLSAAGRAATAARRAAAMAPRPTLGVLVGMQAPVSRTLPMPRGPLQGGSPQRGTPTLGDWLQMTSQNAPDWRYLSGRR